MTHGKTQTQMRKTQAVTNDIKTKSRRFLWQVKEVMVKEA